MKPLFSLKFTIFLSAALFLPFFIKLVNPKLELYPAIILPSGAGKIDLKEKSIEVQNLSIYGYNTQGKLQKIDVVNFLAPIPRQYLYGIAETEFGLSTQTVDEIKIRGLEKRIEVKRRLISLEKQKLAKAWLSKQLGELGLSTSSILIRYEVKKLDLDNGKEISVKINNEKNISLY